MKTRNDYAKIFSISVAFLLVSLIFSVSACPLNAQTSSTTVTLTMPQQVGPENPMYKYLHHVPVTQYEWPGDSINRNTWNRFSQSPTAPETDHLLWKYELTKMIDAFEQ